MQIGISAPQGCGKTTLVTELEKLLEHDGLPCAAVSIDDFYLTHCDQAALAHAHQDNWLLHGRGHAGTHDLALGTKVLQDLTTSRCVVPRHLRNVLWGAHGGKPVASSLIMHGSVVRSGVHVHA